MKFKSNYEPKSYIVYRVGDLGRSILFFAFDYDYAKSYTKVHPENTVKKYAVRLYNPYIVTILDKYPDEASGIVQAYNELFNTTYTYEDIVGYDKKDWENADVEILDKAISLGYDGVIYNIINPGCTFLNKGQNLSELITTKDAQIELL